MSIQLLDGGGSHNVDKNVRMLMKNNILPPILGYVQLNWDTRTEQKLWVEYRMESIKECGCGKANGKWERF